MFPIGLSSHVRTVQRRRASTSASSWTTWSPLALNPAMWFDAADTSTITSSSGAVSQINDKSGNTRHATQATAALQPTTGVDTLNGLNVLTFNDDMLLTSTFTLAQPVTIFVVGARSNTDGVNRQLVGNESTTPTIYSDGNWKMFAGSVLNSGQSSGNTTWHYFTATFNGTASTLRRNGSQIASGNAGTSGYSAKAVNLGGPSTFRWVGYLAEMFVVPSTLDAQSRDFVETYIKTKWGL